VAIAIGAILILEYYFNLGTVSHNGPMQMASVVGNSKIDIALDNGGTANKYVATTGQ
jgi:hypothetical protein